MSAPVCAITGANGFAGQALLHRFQALGWHVVALMRRPEEALQDIEARRFVLGEPVGSGTLAKVDVLIHAAYDFSLYGWADICRVNVVGSEYLFDAAARAGVKRQIFISSLSAFEGCRSHYGLGKLAAEDSVRVRGGVCIRPGMLYSKKNGGLAAKIAAAAHKFPLTPMIGNGHYPLYTCHIDDLCDLIIHLAQTETIADSIITAAHTSPITLRELALLARGDKGGFIIPVPWRFLALALWIAERLGLRPAFRSDSVMSLTHPNHAVDFSAAEKQPIKFRAFDGM